LNKLKKLITNALKRIIKILLWSRFHVNYNKKKHVSYSLLVVTFAGGLWLAIALAVPYYKN